MSRKTKFTKESELVAVRLPREMRKKAVDYCKQEDLTMSQLLRRSVKRELAKALTAVNQEVAA